MGCTAELGFCCRRVINCSRAAGGEKKRRPCLCINKTYPGSEVCSSTSQKELLSSWMTLCKDKRDREYGCYTVGSHSFPIQPWKSSTSLSLHKYPEIHVFVLKGVIGRNILGKDQAARRIFITQMSDGKAI